ncbi:hypothetical protein [Nocardia terpenica]|nr:hypothetical protein [Nocardia terpenica]
MTSVVRPGRVAPELDPLVAHRLSDGVSALAEANDRLVRDLFAAGLRMHLLDGGDAASDELRATVGTVLHEIDTVIHNAGLVTLANMARAHAFQADGASQRAMQSSSSSGSTGLVM